MLCFSSSIGLDLNLKLLPDFAILEAGHSFEVLERFQQVILKFMTRIVAIEKLEEAFDTLIECFMRLLSNLSFS